ncbi:MAG: YcgJ family protein [Cyanobium sp.]
MGPRLRFHPLRPLLGVLGVASLQSAGLALEMPRPGVVCDKSQRICYDSQGASVSQTRRTYGEKAERDLLRQISGRPPVQDFQFSGGEVCSINRRTCWDDGWQRLNVSNRLTRQLFGNSGGGAGGGNLPGESTCQLLQRGRSVFTGGCRLSRRQGFAGSAYVVETRDGRLYSFYKQGNGQLVLRDATGTWPVAYATRANGLAFRWSDLRLEASRGYGSGDGSGGGSGNPWGNPHGASPGYGRSGPDQHAAPTVNTLEGLLNSLFN